MPKALKSCPKSNKSPNLVTLFSTNLSQCSLSPSWLIKAVPRLERVPHFEFSVWSVPFRQMATTTTTVHDDLNQVGHWLRSTFEKHFSSGPLAWGVAEWECCVKGRSGLSRGTCVRGRYLDTVLGRVCTNGVC